MSAAQKFVEETNRTARIESAEKDSIEHQITVNEQWAIDTEASINERRKSLVDAGRLTDQGIEDEIFGLITKFEDDAQRRVEKRINSLVESFKPEFALPEQDAATTALILQTYNALEGDERKAAYREARTGDDPELALALLRGPKRVTRIPDDVRADMTDQFMSDDDRKQAARTDDIRARAVAAIETFESVSRRLRDAN